MTLKWSWTSSWQIYPSSTIKHDGPEAAWVLDMPVPLVVRSSVEVPKVRISQFLVSSPNIHYQLLQKTKSAEFWSRLLGLFERLMSISADHIGERYLSPRCCRSSVMWLLWWLSRENLHLSALGLYRAGEITPGQICKWMGFSSLCWHGCICASDYHLPEHGKPEQKPEPSA